MIKSQKQHDLIAIPDDLPVVDPHCHFWKFDANHYPWLAQGESPLLGDLSSIRRHYLPSDYFADSLRINIKKIIHIEATALAFARQEVENIVILMKDVRMLQGIVAGIELNAADVEQHLAYYSQFPQVKGVRQIVGWHDNPLYRCCDRGDYLTDTQWKKGYALLSQYGFSFSMQVLPQQLSQVIAIANEFPDTPMVVTHAGMPLAEERQIWQQSMRQLSSCMNVMVQLSGFAMVDHNWSVASITPLIEHLIDCFGVDRCFFASNFPIDGLYCRFTELMDSYHSVVAKLSWEDKSKLFSHNAEKFYRV